jgi:hypothetical protein
MEKEQALQEFLNHIPASGEVSYETVENAMRSTPAGRAGIRYINTLRREGHIVGRIDKETGEYFLSRPVVGVTND